MNFLSFSGKNMKMKKLVGLSKSVHLPIEIFMTLFSSLSSIFTQQTSFRLSLHVLLSQSFLVLIDISNYLFVCWF
jgi:hypothetical protein